MLGARRTAFRTLGQAPTYVNKVQGVKSQIGSFGHMRIRIGVPAGSQAGDMLLMFVLNADDPTTIPAGWAILEDAEVAGADRYVCYWHVHNGAEPATRDFEWTDADITAIPHAMLAYRGVLPVAPLSALNVAADQTDDVSDVVAPSVTLTQPQARLVVAFGVLYHNASGGGLTGYPPAGMTSRHNEGVIESLTICDQVVADAGATGTRTVSRDVSGAGPWNVDEFGCSIALLPR